MMAQIDPYNELTPCGPTLCLLHLQDCGRSLRLRTEPRSFTRADIQFPSSDAWVIAHARGRV